MEKIAAKAEPEVVPVEDVEEPLEEVEPIVPAPPTPAPHPLSWAAMTPPPLAARTAHAPDLQHPSMTGAQTSAREDDARAGRATPRRPRAVLILGSLAATVSFGLVVIEHAGSRGTGRASSVDAAGRAATSEEVPPLVEDAPADQTLPACAPAADASARAASTAPAAATAPAGRADAAADPSTGCGTALGVATIASAAAAEDWPAVLERCTALPLRSLSPAERVSCGIAACKHGDRAGAITYRNAARNPAAIERTCAESGLTLPRRPRLPDPCERDPLRCRT